MKFSIFFSLALINLLYMFNWFKAFRVERDIRNNVKYAKLYCSLLKTQHKYYLALASGGFSDKTELRKYIDDILTTIDFAGFELQKLALKNKKNSRSLKSEALKLNDNEMSILNELLMLLEEIVKINAPIYYYFIALKKIAFMRNMSLRRYFSMIVSNFQLDKISKTDNTNLLKYGNTDFMTRYRYF